LNLIDLGSGGRSESVGTTSGMMPEMNVDAVQFAYTGLLDTLEAVPLDGLDAFGFGLILMDRGGDVLGYNQAESRLSGLPVPDVTGRNFFVEIGPCTNNYLVPQRFQDSASRQEELDEQLGYVFTYRMGAPPGPRRV